VQYIIKWSEKAESDYFAIIDYLLDSWGRKSAKDFKNTVEHTIDLISKMPTLYPLTDFRAGLRRCVVVKQVSLYFTLNERVIMVQRILQDFISVQKPVEEVKTDNLVLLRNFKGIAKTGSFNLTDDDWYKQ